MLDCTSGLVLIHVLQEHLTGLPSVKRVTWTRLEEAGGFAVSKGDERSMTFFMRNFGLKKLLSQIKDKMAVTKKLIMKFEVLFLCDCLLPFICGTTPSFYVCSFCFFLALY